MVMMSMITLVLTMMIEICVIGYDDNNHWYFLFIFLLIIFIICILAYFSFHLSTILSYINDFETVRVRC